MKIGYIVEHDLKLSPFERFEFKEATFTRKTNSHTDKIYSEMLAYPIDYKEIVDNAEMMKEDPHLILVQEPFLLDDELRKKVINWCNWANNADPKEYDPFVV